MQKMKTTQEIDEIFEKLHNKYPKGQDPWGLDLRRARRIFNISYPLYSHYFKVQMFGLENLKDAKDQNFMVISNHSGQIAIDGMLISTGFVSELEYPIILRPMIERFMMALPFVGKWSLEGGAVLGDRTNCQHLLDRGESVLVFPEGVRGVSKSTTDFYRLQKFTRGFLRLAINNKVPILPIAVIGAEEFYPYVWQLKKIAKLLKLPAFPVTPTFPWFGPLGALPMPSPVDIYIGKQIDLSESLSIKTKDAEIDEVIGLIQNQIQSMIHEGLKNKRSMKNHVINSIQEMIEKI